MFLALGTFLLWVCWFFFNGGSTYTMFSERKNDSARVIMNTTLAAAMGGITSVILKPKLMHHGIN
jgi:Amt family ammonium transporter